MPFHHVDNGALPPATGTTMTDEPGPDAPQQLSYYRLGRMLGSGGCGVVYEATDVRFNTSVAVKLLHSHLTDDEAYRERFLRETHVASLLRSPYTVQVHQSGVEDGRYFLVMQLIDGGSVADVLRSGPLEPERALRIAAQVARSLEEAELRRITHRDIKPENVMLTADGTVQVVDFGVARQAGAGTLTGTGQFVGTPVYAAPEAALGRADHRSDIYSLGVTLYHMLTGRPPFSGEPLEVLLHHERTPLPTEPLEGLPRAVVEAVERCLAKDPAGRYQTATELAGTLERLAIQSAGRDDLAPTREVEPPAAADGPRRQSLAARGEVGVTGGPPIHYARTSDGVNIAYYTLGQGPASVVMPYVPFSHLHAEWRMPEVREVYESLAQGRTVVRYDNPGSGVSGRDISDFSFGAMVRDLEAVVDDLGLDTFALLGTFISGPVAVAYAAQHAERVSHLVLWCTAPPWPARNLPLPPGAQAVLGALEGDWDVGTETLAHVVMGWSEGDSGRRMAEFVREATTPETMTEALTLLMGVDLAQVLPEVQAPTLVAHCAAFGLTTIRSPREIAAGIENARLAVFDGESAFPDDAVVSAIAEFLTEED